MLRIVKQSSFLDSWFHFQSFCLKLDFKLSVLIINLCTHQTGLSSFSLIRRHTEAHQCLSYLVICWVEVSFAYSEQFYSLEIRENWNVMFLHIPSGSICYTELLLGIQKLLPLSTNAEVERQTQKIHMILCVSFLSVRNVKQMQLT